MPAALCLNVKRDLEPLKHQMVWREMSCFLFFLSSYYPFICWLSFLSITSGIRYSFTWSHPGYYSRFHFHSLFFRSSWLFCCCSLLSLFSLFHIFILLFRFGSLPKLFFQSVVSSFRSCSCFFTSYRKCE